MNAIAHVPTKSDIDGINVGSEVLDCFGRWSKVVEISGRGIDVNGKAFVCFYTDFSDSESKSSISGSYKEDELVRTVATTRGKTSAELDLIERGMIKAGPRTLEFN